MIDINAPAVVTGPRATVGRTRNGPLVRQMMMAMGPDVVDVGEPMGTWEPDVDGMAWIGAAVGEQAAGVIGFDPLNTWAVEIHIAILPDYRREWRHAIVRDALLWLVDSTRYMKVNATIPEPFRHVRRFAVEMGFTRDGVDRASWMTDGRLVDRILYGITRSEIEARHRRH